MDYLLLFYFYHWREHVFKRKCIVELFKALKARDLSRPKTSRSSRTDILASDKSQPVISVTGQKFEEICVHNAA